MHAAELIKHLKDSPVFQAGADQSPGEVRGGRGPAAPTYYQLSHGCPAPTYYQLSHGCQADTEKYLTRGNLYHPRHTCITRDVVEGNTGVSRLIQVFEGQIISPYHPGNHVITTLSHLRNY